MSNYTDSLSRSHHTKEVVTQLRKDIILGKYKPGTRLIEAKLAEQMGISRAPVRTSLQMLALEGLVMNLTNGGTEVIGCSAKDVRDIFELRLLLERTALLSTFKSPTFRYRPLFDAMELLESYKAKGEEITSYDTAYLDISFHRSLILMADNNPMTVAWNTMANTVQAILEITNMTRPTFAEFCDDHRELADMIIQKNEESIQMLDHHIMNAMNIIIERIEKSQY
ncbi:GntR family transcriptional regulator [Paenibacillus nasutitermitis]|uniref:GntR family transcriptional regulator n=1 Tax=Paenibacillus nasutitermitis TaxID=1652958 RepID=A0A916ZF57_9BACL|nr:GntR family transcriptional regulator [Paenibacillus nasutitermitis]GGD93464.1 GntR family transcriptional regulator [Paenibacillus nasutitermitis]